MQRAGLCWPTVSATRSPRAPSGLIDLATLTGAVIIALGSTYAGLMSNDEELAERITSAGERTGEIVWRLPLHPEYEELVKGNLRRPRQRAGSPQGGHDRGRQLPRELRGRRALGASRHRRLRLGSGPRLRRQGRLWLRRAPARRAGALLRPPRCSSQITQPALRAACDRRPRCAARIDVGTVPAGLALDLHEFHGRSRRQRRRRVGAAERTDTVASSTPWTSRAGILQRNVRQRVRRLRIGPGAHRASRPSVR